MKRHMGIEPPSLCVSEFEHRCCNQYLYTRPEDIKSFRFDNIWPSYLHLCVLLPLSLSALSSACRVCSGTPALEAARSLGHG